MRLRHILPLVAASAVMWGCKTHSGSVQQGYEPYETLSKTRLQEMARQLDASAPEWTDVKMPVNLELRQPEKIGVGGQITMKRDDYIHISLRVFGMEMASLMVTQDSIYGVYKLKRLYVAESLKDIMGGKLPVTVSDVQDMLLGRVFVVGGGQPSSGQLAGDTKEWSIQPRAVSGVDYRFTLSTLTGLVESLTVVARGSSSPFTARYSDYESVEGAPCAVPGITELESRRASGVVSAEIRLNPKRAEWDRGNTATISIPSGYTRLSAAKLLRSLSKSK